MQTRELVAGRELDALIAEKVMGWQNWRGSDHSGLIGGTWSPSTSIDAAWQVVERCDSFTVYRSVGGWVADLSLPKGMEAQAFAETAPLAICKAALASAEK